VSGIASSVSVGQDLDLAVARFLFHEAELLDEWRLDDWLGLFDPSARYEIPATNAPGSDPGTHQFLIAEDAGQVAARVRRLQSRNAHAENPHSRTRRLVTNVRAAVRADGDVDARANFLVFRFRRGARSEFVGEYRHILRPTEMQPGFRFVLRRAELDVEQLTGDGRISIPL